MTFFQVFQLLFTYVYLLVRITLRIPGFHYTYPKDVHSFTMYFLSTNSLVICPCIYTHLQKKRAFISLIFPGDPGSGSVTLSHAQYFTQSIRQTPGTTLSTGRSIQLKRVGNTNKNRNRNMYKIILYFLNGPLCPYMVIHCYLYFSWNKLYNLRFVNNNQNVLVIFLCSMKNINNNT